MSDVAGSKSQPIGSTRTNSTNVGSSHIKQEVDGEPLAFLHPGTGEIVIVPPEQSGSLMTEARVVSDAVAQYHSANLAVQTLDEYRRANYNNVAECARTDAALEDVLQWQDEAHQAYYEIFGALEPLPDETDSNHPDQSSKSADGKGQHPKEDSLKLNGTAKKLTELVSLKKLSPQDQAKKKAEDKKGKLDKSGYTKILLEKKGLPYLKEFVKAPTPLPEKILYVRRDKIHWPQMKVLDNKGWKDVLVPDPMTGKKSIDRRKLGKYVASKSADAGVSWLKKHFKENLEYSKSETVDWWIFDVCDSWNKELQYDKTGQLEVGVVHADVDLSANAQLMRYSYGVSLDPDLSFSDKKISVRAEGHAEINAAKGEAKLTLAFPRKEGWIWTRTSKTGKSQDVVAVVCMITASASAVAGASIAGELSIQLSASEVTTTPPKIKGKPGKKGYKARRQNRMELKKGDEVNPTGLDAGVSIFAGAKADASIEGALQWRDPEDQKNHDFATIASIAPAVGGMAGLAGELKLTIEYVRGMFRVTTHASLCFGLGAEGVLTFAVSAEQVEKFCKCIFYKVAYGEFENLGIFTPKAFKVLSNLRTIAYLNDRSSIAADYGRDEVDIAGIATKALASATPQELNELAASAPQLLAYALPETKGALICRMCQSQIASGDTSTLEETRKGVLQIFRTAVLSSELDNIMQHTTPEGSKGIADAVMAELESFFRLGMAGQGGESDDVASSDGNTSADAMDQLALSGDFRGWYEAFGSQLIDRLPRGFPVVQADSIAYESLRGSNDHPLYTSEGWNAFYSEDA